MRGAIRLAGRYRFPLFGAGALFVCLAAGVWAIHWLGEPAQTTQPFRIGYEKSLPYQDLKPDGSPTGPAIEIITEAARRAGVPIQWVHAPKGPDLNLTNGNVDLWPLIGDVPSRRGEVYISAPWISVTFWLISRANNPFPATRDAVGYRVAVHHQRVHEDMLRNTVPGAVPVLADSNEGTLQALCRAEVDAAIFAASVAAAGSFDSGPCRGVPLNFAGLPNGKVMMGIGASYRRADARRAADALRAEMDDMAHGGFISSVYRRHGMDPSNEVLFVSYLTQSQRMSRYLTLALMAVSGILLLLVVQLLRMRASQQAARRAQQEAEQAGRAKAELLGEVSRELRTGESGGKAQRLADSIATYCEVESGTLTLQRVPVNLGELVQSGVRAFVARAEQKGLTFKAEISTECPAAFEGDPARLRQVLLNLLESALRFTGQGGVLLCVKPVAEHGRQFLQFSVTNSGAALADPGSGDSVSLAAARSLVKLMGGSLAGVEWPEGAGYQFSIPLVQAESSAAAGD